MMKIPVAIIGGGAIAVSIAKSLAERGVKGVSILERDLLSSGATGLAAGIVSPQLWNPVDFQLVKQSILIFKQLANRFPESFTFQSTGVLTIVESTQDRTILERLHAELSRLGIRSELFPANAIAESFPGIRIGASAFGLFGPDDGCINPTDFTRLTAKDASEHGVRILTGQDVRRILTRNGLVASFETEEGIFDVDSVIVAAGAWSGGILRSASVDLPLKPYRTQLMTVKLRKPIKMPALHDIQQDFYIRPQTDTMLLVGDGTEQTESNPNNFRRDPSPDFIHDMAKKLSYRILGASDSQFVGGWAGVCTSTPDRLPLVGRIRKVEGLFCACGLQGYGVMRAPAIGEAFASIFCGEKPVIDISSFDPNRFGDARDFTLRPGYTLV